MLGKRFEEGVELGEGVGFVGKDKFLFNCRATAQHPGYPLSFFIQEIDGDTLDIRVFDLEPRAGSGFPDVGDHDVTLLKFGNITHIDVVGGDFRIFDGVGAV